MLQTWFSYIQFTIHCFVQPFEFQVCQNTANVYWRRPLTHFTGWSSTGWPTTDIHAPHPHNCCKRLYEIMIWRHINCYVHCAAAPLVISPMHTRWTSSLTIRNLILNEISHKYSFATDFTLIVRLQHICILHPFSSYVNFSFSSIC